MSDTADVPAYLTDPVAVITRLVLAIEPDLTVRAVEDAVASTLKHKTRLRRLAQVLEADPDLLTSGRPEGPPAIQRLIRALLAAGARHVVLPRCAHCGEQKPLRSLDGSSRICAWCAMRKTATAEPCSVCGHNRHVSTRDRRGRPRCAKCPPDSVVDPIEIVIAVVEYADTGLSRAQIVAATLEALPKPAHRRQVAWALEDNPALLTGQGARGSAKVLKLLDALIAKGARTLVVPPCPQCGANVKLTHQIGEQRCCRRCYDDTQRAICARCGRRDARIATRTLDGDPLCHQCWRTDSINFERCSHCGRDGNIVRRTEDQQLCSRCFQLPVALCSICERKRPCYFAATDTPRCTACTARLRTPETCSRCGHERVVAKRLADGQPLCTGCATPRETCMLCGRTKKVLARTDGGHALCRPCYDKHPAGRRTCIECGTVARPYHHGLCASCARTRSLIDLLGDANRQIRPDLQPVVETLRRSAPLPVLWWLRRSANRHLLTALATAAKPPTHELLDTLRPVQAVGHLRAALIANGVLPARDEHLARLEHWIPRVTARVENGAERRIVHSFATWHHLRRLRRLAQVRPLTYQGTIGARRDVRAAVQLLTWLHEHDSTLSTATQPDIDLWIDKGPGERYAARTFVSWAVQHRHAHQIHIPYPAKDTPMTFIDRDRRWDLIRRLLNDDDLETSTRVSGLLLLLYAQSLTRISQLRLQDVSDKGEQVTLALGPVPNVVPPPLDDLVRKLADQRHGRSAIGRSNQNPWLFPGGAAGRPISSKQLMRRLQALGVRGRPARNTALMELASELPAIVISRLLGLHISCATRWTQEAAPSRAEYGAQLATKGRVKPS